MKKTLLTLTAMGALALGPQAFAEEHTVKMLNSGEDGPMVFEPAYLKVAPGDTVTFEPTDPAHNSVSEYVPEGATTWNGAINEAVTVQLDTEGVYLYKCTPHVPLGMVGVIQVGDEAANLEEAKEAAETLKSAIAMNQERLDKYLGQVE